MIRRASCMVGLLLVGACAPMSEGPDLGPTAPTTTPAYAELVEAQARRLDALSPVKAEGSVEVRWTEADGSRQFHQGQLQLFLELPSRTAVRITKIADVIFWLGSNEDQVWLFNQIADPTTLTLADHDTALAGLGPGLGAARPDALLELLALRPLPAPGPADPPVAWNVEEGGWRVDLPATDESPARWIVFEDHTLLPIAAGIAGGYSSRLRQYTSFPRSGLPVGAWPRMPGMADITGDGGSMKLALRDPTGDVPASRLARVFDLDRLRGHLRPEVVEVLGSSP